MALLAVAVMLMMPDRAAARLMTDIYLTDWNIDTTQVNQLRINLNSLLFFRDNEFSGSTMKGYTLPGFRMRPTLSYKPNQYINVDLGMYMLRYWGADSYPNLAYRDLAYWKGDDGSIKGFHIVPFFRVQMATKGGLNIVLGSIYGGGAHRLIEPMYAQELNLTSDPEAGVQLLYSCRLLDIDAWVNWESFIFRDDTHQEAFVVGLSSKLKYTRPDARWHLYTPIQLLAQHRGGEIDQLTENSVQTLMNGAVGFGARLNINHHRVRSVTMEADFLGYYQQAGHLWPYANGTAWNFHGSLDMDKMKFKAGYFTANKFISMFGYPFFGSISTKNPGLLYQNPSTLYFSFEYSHTFAPGYSLGASFDIYQQMPCGANDINQKTVHDIKAATSFAAGVYLRINPSFILKSFNR